MTATTQLLPPLKWAGGKRWLIPTLRPIWTPHTYRRLVEPFCGGLSIALGLNPERALLNDINPHLINFYTHIQRGLQLSIPIENNAELYYQYRQRFNKITANEPANSTEQAELFYAINRMCFNGLIRYNSKGEINVPFGKYNSIHHITDFTPYRSTLAQWDFTETPFEQIPLLADDFIYADPPYDVEFVQYTKQGFTWQDQMNLIDWLAQHTGPVVISNQATPRIVELYTRAGYHLQYLSSPRRISANGDRTPAQEILATRNLGTQRG